MRGARFRRYRGRRTMRWNPCSSLHGKCPPVAAVIRRSGRHRFVMVAPVTAPSDMGGRTDFFGPVVRECDEPTFHERWEGRVFGLSFFLQPLFGGNVDKLRFAMEQLPADVYLSS